MVSFAPMERKTMITRRKITASILLAALIALMFWACYPKRVGTEGPDGKRLTWAEMNMDQRKAHMESVVLPRAADVFREWRPERFTRVDCSLCHGRGVDTETFRMPTAHLPRLSGELLLGPEFAQHPDTTRLKLNRLVPLMAEVLGKKPFSIVTRTGFGCYSCHLGPSGPMFGN